MGKKNRAVKLNKTALYIAIIHFVISFFTDKIIFKYTFMDFSNLTLCVKSILTIGVKIIFLLIVIGLWQGIFYFFKEADRKFKNYTLFYFACMMVMLVLTWPGIWRMDEFSLLYKATYLMPLFWQNYITSVFYVFALMLIPIPSGIIIVMVCLNSLMVGRITSKFERIYAQRKANGKTSDLQPKLQNNEKQRKNAGFFAKFKKMLFYVLLFIPFFLAPVIDSNLYPMRMNIYAFLELTLVSELFFLFLDLKEVRKNGEIKRMSIEQGIGPEYIKRCVLLSILAGLVTVWRTEAIYYLILFPLALFLIIGKKQWIKPAIIYIITFVILFAPQKVGEKFESGQQYELTGIVLPLVPLVSSADPVADSNELSAIDKVVNLEIMEKAREKGKNGISMFWSEPDFQREYTEQDFAGFKSAYYSLVKKYPMVFLQERMQTFIDSSDLLENTTQLFTKEDVPNYEQFRQYPCTNPISNKIRTSVIKTLEIRNAENYEEKLFFTDKIYSAIPAIVILIIALVILATQRKWIQCFLILLPSCRIPLVFLTAPSRLFMYYYSVYLIGYVLLFYSITYLLKAENSLTEGME